MVRVSGTGGSCMRQAWQFIPAVGKATPMSLSVAVPTRASLNHFTTPVSSMQVSLSLPSKNKQFSPSKFFEKIATRFGSKEPAAPKKDDNLTETLEGSSKEIEDGVFCDPQMRENIIGTLQEETIRAGIVIPQTIAEGEEIASVTEDDRDSSILWEQREKDVKAERERRVFTSPGFSFSAAGLLFPYHLGVCQCLFDNDYITEDTPLAGSSAGALVCAIVGGGVNMYEALQATKELAHDCRANGTAFRLGAVLRLFLQKFLPDDVHEKVNGRIRVGITQVFRQPRGLLVDSFDSKEDLINALHTSCFIPGYFAPRPVTVFRDRVCIDGGVTMFMPPTAADETVWVCAFPSFLRGTGISPDCNPSEGRANTRQLFNWALEPAQDDILDDLFALGYQDALVWVKQNSSTRRQNGEPLSQSLNMAPPS